MTEGRRGHPTMSNDRKRSLVGVQARTVAEAEGEVKTDIAVEGKALRQIWTLEASIARQQLLRHREGVGVGAETGQ